MTSIHRFKQALSTFGWLLAVVGVGAVSCRGADDSESAGASCAEIGERLGRLCNFTTARQAELQCEMFGASRSARECVFNQLECTTCGLTNIIAVCDVDDDCPGDLRCHAEREECTECVSDTDCAAPLYCPDGYCIPMHECLGIHDCPPPALCNANRCRVLTPCENDADCEPPDQCVQEITAERVCMVVN